MHFEKKEGPVYDLGIAKGGPKLKEAVPAPSPNEMPPASQTNTRAVQKLALGKDGFPDLPQRASMAIIGNKAGPKKLETSDTDGPTLIQAVQEQFGLKLEQKKGSIEILVVDHVEEPSEN